MGFGFLFIGYFFFFNIAYPAYTDLLAALLMLSGLDKLARINRPFSLSRRFCLLFAGLSLYELAAQLALLFSVTLMPDAVAVAVAILRDCLLLGLTISLLKAVGEVAKEVDLQALVKRCERSVLLPCYVYLIRIVLEIPAVSVKVPAQTVALLGSLILLFELFVVFHNLRTFFSAYRLICMPEDVDMPQKPSRFAFVNAYRERAQAAEEKREAARKERHLH